MALVWTRIEPDLMACDEVTPPGAARVWRAWVRRTVGADQQYVYRASGTGIEPFEARSAEEAKRYVERVLSADQPWA